MIAIGIDPGASGGIAVIDGYEHVTRVYAMPQTESDTWGLVSELARWPGELRAVIERVHAFPGQGVSSSFTFGRNYGFLRACLIAAQVPFEEVFPRTWQTALGCMNSKKLAKPAHKRKLRGVAQQLFPAVDVTLKTCDALLLAEFLRRRENGK